MEWNQGQWEAITHRDGPALVLAGPGSGKTAVIVNHVKFLLEEGVPGSQILVLTFTRAAATEMEERFGRLDQSREGAAVTFGTFHSVCFQILKEECGYTQKSLLGEEEKRRILKEVLFRKKLLRANAEVQLDRLLAEIGRKKGASEAGQPAGQPEAPEFERVFAAYQQELAARKRLDFDDLLSHCFQLLAQNECIRRKWQAVYRYCLVDEYQDLNRLQVEMMRLLAGATGHVFAVGDEDQSIYRFRGADPTGMLAFSEMYPGARRIMLAVNYRSVPEILAPAARLIGHNKERFPKKIRSARPSAGLAVTVQVYEDVSEQNAKIVKEMQRLNRQGQPYEKMAVLFRSISAARPLMRVLADHQIPFTCKEIPEEARGDWAVLDLEAYWNLARSDRWRRKDLLRILNRPDRGLPRTGLEQDQVDPEEWLAQFQGVEGYEEAARALCRVIARLKRMDFYAGVSYLWHGAGYGDYVRAVCREKEVSEQAVWRQIEAWRARREGDAGKAQKREPGEIQGRPVGVSLMTMHASKGLEFPVVFLPELNEGVIPHSRSHTEKELEEERRLMYVAVTRAKDRLYLSWVKTRYRYHPPVSRFVKEMGIGQ